MSIYVNGARPALTWLWRVSLLGEHPRTATAYDQDRGMLNLDALDLESWSWSSGEAIMVRLAAGIATDNCDVTVQDLWRLDELQRDAAAWALHLWWMRADFGDVAEVGL